MSALMMSDLRSVGCFRLLALGKGVFHDFNVHVDDTGLPWAWKATTDGCLGFSLAKNWLFDDYAVEMQSEEAGELRLQILRTEADRHRAELNCVLDEFRLGPRLLRLAFVVYRSVISRRTSVFQIPDRMLGAAAWGNDPNRWPRHWRSEILNTLRSLTWLHFAPEQNAPAFGRHTALLTHVGDMKGSREDQCDGECCWVGQSRHSHILVNVGAGFMGVLEQCAVPDIEAGVRHYQFPIDARNKSTATLRRLGRTGRLTTFFLPAVLGDPDACNRLSADEGRLLPALFRETTRRTKEDRRETGEAEVLTGNVLPLMSNEKPGCCPFLDASTAYVGFNGNGFRKGQGYRLNSSGGWLAKAGYPHGEMVRFLRDLENLSSVFGLTVVGLLPNELTWRSLSQMRAMTSTVVDRAKLERLHVRVYTPSDYLERWSRIFDWSDNSPSVCVTRQRHQEVVEKLQRLAQTRGFRAELARSLDFDASLLSKVFTGKKRWPDEWLERADEWLKERPQLSTVTSSSSLASVAPTAQLHSFHHIALGYLRHGFSIVPQLKGEKRPCVPWKPFQERRPTERDLESWSRRWPDAGLALVLGPVSNAFVIDVDGSEGHQALIARLGTEPVAPKVISGSRRPDRYHLFFRCPAVPTKAKATPWHPKLEFRGYGGVIVLPPSIHASGLAYSWADGQSLDDLSMPELPTSVLESLTAICRAVPRSALAAPLNTSEIVGSQRTLAFLTGQFADAPGWNSRLFDSACDLHGRGMPLEQAEALLLAAARPWNPSEQEAALRTIRSAFSESREPARA